MPNTHFDIDKFVDDLYDDLEYNQPEDEDLYVY